MKKIIAAAAIAFTTLSTFAGVMNWQVADTSDGNGGYYQAARLVARKDGEVDVTVADSDGYYYQDASSGVVGSTQTADLSSLTGYNFYIELGAYSSGFNPAVADNSSTWTAQTSASIGSYEQLLSSGAISSAMAAGGGGLAGKTVSPAKADFGAVPEPCTATLILLGMAVAGLKRRRA